MNIYWSSGVFCKKDIARLFGREAKPFERVILAILRLSRGKFITPEYVRNAEHRFSLCLQSSNHWRLAKQVFQDEDMYRSNFVGIMDGMVPFQDGGVEFTELMRFLEKRHKKPFAIELFILKLTIQELKNGS